MTLKGFNYVETIVVNLDHTILAGHMRLPPIEKFRNDYQDNDRSIKDCGLSSRELLKRVLSNKDIWLLGFAYFFLYVLRMGISDWTGLFLYEIKGYSALGSSGTSSLFEVGGFFGCLAAGWSSDRFFDAKRGPVKVMEDSS